MWSADRSRAVFEEFDEVPRSHNCLLSPQLVCCEVSEGELGTWGEKLEQDHRSGTASGSRARSRGYSSRNSLLVSSSTVSELVASRAKAKRRQSTHDSTVQYESLKHSSNRLYPIYSTGGAYNRQSSISATYTSPQTIAERPSRPPHSSPTLVLNLDIPLETRSSTVRNPTGTRSNRRNQPPSRVTTPDFHH